MSGHKTIVAPGKVMIKFIKIFIKSWKYYPKMVAYLKYRYEIQYEQSRFKYSLRMAISGARRYKTCVANGVEDSWKAIYLEELIERGGE